MDWTLDAPTIAIVGVNSNVPEGGRLDGDQAAWLTAELQAAPKNAALVLTMHHPIYPVDAHHRGSSYLGDRVDKVIADSGRMPDLIISGNLHNYQRLTRDFQGQPVPYAVNGAGGCWHLHYVAKDADGSTITTPWQDPATGVTLESYAHTRYGFLRMEVSAEKLTGTNFTVPRPPESWHCPAQLHDTFVITLRGAGG